LVTWPQKYHAWGKVTFLRPLKIQEWPQEIVFHHGKHEAKFIMNQTFADQKVYEWEGSYAYSSIVEASHTYNKALIKHLEKNCSVFGGHLISINFPPRNWERYYAYSSIVGGFLHP
jgi:hypothetical protein